MQETEHRLKARKAANPRHEKWFTAFEGYCTTLTHREQRAEAFACLEHWLQAKADKRRQPTATDPVIYSGCLAAGVRGCRCGRGQEQVNAAKALTDDHGISKYGGEAATWSTRRVGELIETGQKVKLIADGPGRPKKGDAESPLTIREALGGEMSSEEAKQVSSRAKRIASIPEATVKEYTASAESSGDEISKAGLIRFAT